MKLRYFSRTGNFDWAHPQDVSVSCNLSVIDTDGKKLINVNFHPDQEYDGDDVDEAIWLLKEAHAAAWINTDKPKWLEAIEFLENNREAIELGTQRALVAKLEKQLVTVTAELASSKTTLENLEKAASTASDTSVDEDTKGGHNNV